MELGDIPLAEEGIARRCWEKYKKESSSFALFTPFFVCVAADNLDYECFCDCVSQDVHFLQAFIQAYETAENCANDEEEKSEIRQLRESLSEKLRVYDNVVRKWGFHLEKKKISDATAKYRDFLLRTASGNVEEGVPCKTATQFEKTKVAAYILGAIAPFFRLYIHLCETIRDHNNLNSYHIYKKWIQYNSSLEIQDLAIRTEELLDKLSVSLTGEELQITEKLYHQALKLQVEFFASQPISLRSVVPLTHILNVKTQLIVFCDFDLTCSKVDSSAIMAELAIVTSPHRSKPSTDLRKEFDDISKQYSEGFAACVESVTSGDPGDVFDYEGLSGALEQVAVFEKNANAKIEESGVLRGLNLRGLKRAGENLVLQKGCREFFQRIVKNDNPKIDVHIISYCWCGDIIRSAFSSDLEAQNVHSNELAYNKKSVSTGKIVKKVESPMEKLQVFMEILKGYKTNTQGRQLKVYMGGSPGDLLCLVEANIGIVYGSSSESIKKLGRHYGVSFVPLLHGTVTKQSGRGDWKPRSGFLYTVDSWAEIQSFILGL